MTTMLATDDRATDERRLAVLDESHTLEEGLEVHRVELHVPPGLLYFRGHFEGDPILAGVVQLDHMVLAKVEQIWPELLGRLTCVQRLKFQSPIRPDDVVLLRLERAAGGAESLRFRITRGEVCCTCGTLVFGERHDR